MRETLTSLSVHAIRVQPEGAVTFAMVPSFTAILASIKSPTETTGLFMVNCVMVMCAEMLDVEVPETIAAKATALMHSIAIVNTTKNASR